MLLLNRGVSIRRVGDIRQIKGIRKKQHVSQVQTIGRGKARGLLGKEPGDARLRIGGMGVGDDYVRDQDLERETYDARNPDLERETFDVRDHDLGREIYDELRAMSGHLKAIQFSAAWIAFLLTVAAAIAIFRGFTP